MKSRKSVSYYFALISLFVGVGLLSYPTISNIVNDRHSSKAIASYQEAVEKLDDSLYRKELEKAKKHNARLAKQGFLAAGLDMERKDGYKDYHARLNVSKDGMMAIIRIPKIHVKLPIYHKTNQDVISRAIGHYTGSSLPIGGKSSHAILSGHRGLPSANLFSDLDQLQKGDIFYIEVLNETLAYQVDKTKTIDPKDVSDLDIISNKDYVTLLTCTPYGVNTHRLLVRGERIPYKGHEEVQKDRLNSYFYSSTFKETMVVLALLLGMIVLMWIYYKKGKKE